MKKIKREIYLNKLINRKENGLIKVITGIRRCSKSYLLDPLFTDYFKENGVKDDHIIKIELDVYVTGSNSKFLSSDIITEFRGRGDEFFVFPFSYSEFLEAYDGEKQFAWKEYVMYGGLLLVVQKNPMKKNFCI